MRRYISDVCSAKIKENQQLEKQSTALLVASLNTMGRGEYPFYTTSYMRKLADIDTALVTEVSPCDGEILQLNHKLLWRLTRAAQLNSTQLELLRLVVDGNELPAIAQILKIKPARAHAMFNALLHKLEAQAKLIPVTTEQEIESCRKEQEHVNCYRPEQHCQPGREACLRNGVCTRRWYLTQN